MDDHNNVTRPTHYARSSLEPIQLIDALELGYYEGNVVKYVCRHTHKNGLEDLKKAAWYLDRLIAKAEGEQRYPTIPTPTCELVDTEPVVSHAITSAFEARALALWPLRHYGRASELRLVLKALRALRNA